MPSVYSKCVAVDRKNRPLSSLERWIGSVRRECLEKIIVLGERHLQRILAEFLNIATRIAHQGLGGMNGVLIFLWPRVGTRATVATGLH